MHREAWQETPATAQRQVWPAAAARPGRRKLLIVLLGLALLLAVAAGWIQLRVATDSRLRIPPIDTAGLLPAVSDEIREKQARVVENPLSADAWGEYGLVLLAHGFRKEAGDCFGEAETLDPANYRWPYYLGMTMGVWDADQSRRAFERAVEKSPLRLALRLRLAEWLFDLRQLDACQRHVAIALQQDAGSVRGQLLQARLLFQRGAAEESLAWAQQAARSPQGNRRDVHELLARIYQRLGNTEAAAVAIEQSELLPSDVAMWDDPEMGFGAMYLQDASMLNTLAEISRARGDVDGCLQRLRQIVTREPDNFIGKEKLAATLVEFQRFDEAATFLETVLAQHPRTPDLLYLRGRVHIAQGEPERARERFEHAVQLKPDYDEAYAYLGRVCLDLGAQAVAVVALREAIRLSPSRVDYYRVYAQALVTGGESDAAIEALRQAVRLAPANEGLHRQLIETLLEARRTAEAIEQLKKAAQQVKDPQPFEKLLHTLQVRPDEPVKARTPGKDTRSTSDEPRRLLR
ncbi:MAG: tetratricopeptide repeat protein [Pirellulaceae bacterium]